MDSRKARLICITDLYITDLYITDLYITDLYNQAAMNPIGYFSLFDTLVGANITE